MTTEKTRIAVIGVGNVAQIAHLPAYARRSDVEITAIVDEDLVKGRKVGQQFGVDKVFEDFTQMIRKVPVDAVDICTPNYLHAPMAVTALRAGLHVLCEKPIARTAAEAAKMVDTAKEQGRILMVAMNNRFRRDVEILRHFVEHEELGQVQLVKAGWRRPVQDWKDRGWFADRSKAGGGVLLDLGLPKMDLAMWIAGLEKPTRVTCNVFRSEGRKRVEDSACAMVNFAAGNCLMLEVTWSLVEQKPHVYLEVYGNKGAATLHPFKIHKALHGHLVDVTPALERIDFYTESYRLEIDHFIDCIRNQLEPRTTGEEAAAVLGILDAMYESAASGREVSLT